MITESKDPNSKRKLQKITNKRVNKGQIYYYATWKGLPQKQGMWLPINNLVKCQKKIDQFQKRNKNQKRQQIKRRILLRKTKAQLKMYENNKMDATPLFLELKQIKLDSDESVLECSQDQQPTLRKNNVSKELSKSDNRSRTKVSRFDCINGIWFNKTYTTEELKQINELRENYALQYQASSSAVIKKIIKINQQQVVLYQRQNKMHQCLLQNFKLYLPQLLIQYILQHYDPAEHRLIKSDIKKIQLDDLSEQQVSKEQ